MDFYFAHADGRPAIFADLDLPNVCDPEVYVAHHPAEIARLADEGRLDGLTTVALDGHIGDEIGGVQVGPYSCSCAACEHDHAEAQRGEIEAEMAIERYYEGGWDKTGEYSAELYN
jgi:hypothetical protein